MVVALNATPSGNGRTFRFSRQFRLKSPQAIRQVMQDSGSSRKRYDWFRVVCAAGTTGDSPRFAFVVSRDAGPAVVRNRIKRRFREAVRLQRESWPINSARVIFRVNEGTVAETPFENIATQVRLALNFSKQSTTQRPPLV